MPKRMPPTEILLALGYGLGVVGSLWDWRQHLAGIITQPPHFTIDGGGLIVIAVLAFDDRRGQGSSAFLAAYLLLVLVGLVILGPFGLMMFAPHTGFTAGFMRWTMTTGGLVVLAPLCVLAVYAAWGWLRATGVEPWRLIAAGGIVVVAVGTVIDLQWHQQHPMASDMSMNMLELPGHQIVLGGFVIGLIGSLASLLRRLHFAT